MLGSLGSVCRVSTLLLSILTSVSYAATVSLPSYPLAVKSPYLSTWVPGHQLVNAATAQPEFWAGQDLNWTILARVNNKAYSLFGAPKAITGVTAASTKSVSYTSSHTYVTLMAGAVTFNLDFFSPVFPGTADYARQSLPYSYLTVNATSTSSVTVQILSAIDASWTAQNGASALNFTTAGNVGYFQYHNSKEIPFTEVGDMATYGSVIFGSTTGDKVAHGCGKASDLYAKFVNSGTLTASPSCSNTDTAALRRGLGTFTGAAPKNATFVVGFDRVQSINYLGKAQTGLYRSKWPTVQSAVQYVLSSYGSALTSSLSFDSEVRSKAAAVSSSYGTQYADIVEASVRQTFGAIELTVGSPDYPLPVPRSD